MYTTSQRNERSSSFPGRWNCERRMVVFYSEEEMMIFSEYPEKTEEELVLCVESSIEQAKAEGAVFTPGV